MPSLTKCFPREAQPSQKRARIGFGDANPSLPSEPFVNLYCCVLQWRRLFRNDKDAHSLVEHRSPFSARGGGARRGAPARADTARVRSRLFAVERYGSKLPRGNHQEISRADRAL